ncbi:MAG TPA: hypothetical protein VJ483_10575 [Holophagaceae bacterium]|nr:hypothetical protein [Holophagaceae bacterium]
MRQFPLRTLVPAVMALACASGLRAQDFDPVTKAQGWAHQDRDASFIFLDGSSRRLITWDRSFGIMGSVSIAALGEQPQMWLPDKYGNIWAIAGTNLTLVGKDGKIMRREKLPGEVGDLAWDGLNGFVLSYRTAQPYLEMRDYKTAEVLWSYGTKPGKNAIPTRTLHRVLMRVLSGQNSTVLLAEGGNLGFTAFDGAKGKPEGQMLFDFNGAVPPALDLGKGDPGPACMWYGKNVAFISTEADQLPASLGLGTGQVLARMDLGASFLQLIPTKLGADYRFIGVADKEAVFMAPQGGLVFVPVK